MITASKFWVKLRNRKYRKAFTSTQVRQGMAFQIRAMRKKLGWTQQELADRSNLPQPSISRAEDLNYGKLTISTLLSIADGFDAALLVRIVPYSQLAQLFEQLSEESVQVATFSEEDARRDDHGELRPTQSVVANARAGTPRAPTNFSVDAPERVLPVVRCAQGRAYRVHPPERWGTNGADHLVSSL